MRFLRYQLANEPPRQGWLYEGLVGSVEGNILYEYRRLEAVYSQNKVRLLPPLFPGKILGIEQNFPETEQQIIKIPEIPVVFSKLSTTIIGPGEAVVLPPQAAEVRPSVHLAIVIGQKGRWISPERAIEHFFGYTVAVEMNAVDLRKNDKGSDTRSRGFDTFLSIGPWIETELDTSDILVTLKVKNDLRQMISTREMVYSPSQLVSFISTFTTLNPGDLILTGSPATGGVLMVGDSMTAAIEGIGELTNPVIKENR